ncbi:uncharacterized protein FN964_007835 isoform 2-T8 [Alca torda]
MPATEIGASDLYQDEEDQNSGELEEGKKTGMRSVWEKVGSPSYPEVHHITEMSSHLLERRNFTAIQTSSGHSSVRQIQRCHFLPTQETSTRKDQASHLHSSSCVKETALNLQRD